MFYLFIGFRNATDCILLLENTVLFSDVYFIFFARKNNPFLYL